MAAKELIELAIDLVQPCRRDPILEQLEDQLPELQDTVKELKDIACLMMTRIRSIGYDDTYCRALEALNSLEAPSFDKLSTWGTDEASLDSIRTTVSEFSQSGHTGIAYILQIKLMQHGVPRTQDDEKVMPTLRKQFAKDFEDFLHRSYIEIPTLFRGNQMYTPKLLLRQYGVAKQVLYDHRPDWLGRPNFQILYDAGVPHEWIVKRAPSAGRREGSVLSFQFIVHLAHGFRMIERAPQEIDRVDRLGRSMIHLLVRQGGVGDVITVLEIGGTRDLRCLNGMSLLHIAACHGDIAMMIHLLKDRLYSHGLNFVDYLDRTPFWYAARGSHLRMLEVLAPDNDTEYVDVKDFDPFQVDSYGHSALAVAARDGRADVLAYLLSLRLRRWKANPVGPMINVCNEHLLLAYAIQSTNMECIKLVLNNRVWRFGDPVHQQAMIYANFNSDHRLQSVLNRLYKEDYKLNF